MPSQTDLQIAYRTLGEIFPDPGNARTHSKSQIEQIAASIREFGFTNPVLIDEGAGLIAGHGRLMAARRLGLTSIPTITLAGLSEIEKRALRLADNKIALNAGWDSDLLRIELEALVISDIDIATLGFSTGEMDVILSDKVGDPDDKVIPELPKVAVSEPGDIWILGDHRVGCGDCRDLSFLRSVVGEGEQVDAAFLDPPYNVRIQGHANVKSRHREFAMASGEMSEAQFQTFLRETLGACAAVSRPGAVHYVCMDWRHMADVQASGGAVYGDLLNLCIWNKSNAGMGSLYRSKHELIYVFRVGDAPHFNAVELGRHGRNRTNVWDYPSVNSFGSRQQDLALHPTVKPVAMVAEAFKDVTRRGDLVLDTFLGSGASLIAAERSGRRFRGMDIDPLYVDLVVERWRNLTGGRPRLKRTGKAA